MIDILLGLTQQTHEDATSSIRMLRGKTGALSKEEDFVISYVEKVIEDANSVPSISMLANTFPQLTGKLNETPVPDPKDLSKLIALFHSNRGREQLSSKFLDMSSKVLEGNIDSEDYQSLLSSMLTSEKEDDKYSDPFEKAEDYYTSRENLPEGIQTGVKDIDDIIGGITPGTITSIMGFTASFKTTWAVNIAYGAVKEGYNVAYISLEVTSQDLINNVLSRHSFERDFDEFPYIPHEKIRKRKLTDEEKDIVYKKIKPSMVNQKGKLYLLEEADFGNYEFLSIEKKLKQADELAMKQTGKGLDMIVVDQLSLLKFASGGGRKSEGEMINAYVSYFRQQALNFLGSKRTIAILALSQANREGHKRASKNNGKYDLRAIAEANEIERASYIILSAYSDDNLKEAKEVRVCILKNRSGEVTPDPIPTYVEPAAYAFGSLVEGFDDVLSADSFGDDMFGDDDGMFGL